MKQYGISQDLQIEVEKFGATGMEACMQCGICTATCSLSKGSSTFPRKIYRYLQLGLTDKILESPEPWLCYYCGDCNTDCPRGAEPAETMMATRRWLTTQYDFTGLAKRLYLSKAWEFGALITLALGIILLFLFFHGPIITEHVSVNSFVPVLWIEVGDLLMAAVLSTFLMINAFRMYRSVMGKTKVPLWLYFSQAKEFVLHFATQKRWQTCVEDKTNGQRFKLNSRWLKHFLLVTGYMTKMMLVIVFIRWFQRDSNAWHFTSLFGYYTAVTVMYFSGEMLYSRYKKREEAIHRFSHSTDWLFLILLFATSLSGSIMHLFRMVDWAIPTYVMYVVHLAIAVPMLVIEVPFGKWSHLFYRPLAIFLTTVKEKATKKSENTVEALKQTVNEAFMSCMQCGTCTTVCPVNNVSSYSPRQILRSITTDSATVEDVDHNIWNCLTCNTCVVNCPRGIEILEVTKAVRERNLDSGEVPKFLRGPLNSLKKNGNPWNGNSEKRMDWADDTTIPSFTKETEYCLFNCCSTAYDDSHANGGKKAGQALNRLLQTAGVSIGTLGSKENCCGDLANKTGAKEAFSELAGKNTNLFLDAGIQKLVTTSPHCLNTFKNEYPGLNGEVIKEHSVELLNRLIKDGSLQPTKELNLKVTYHDPCYLGRYSGIYEEPRQVLQSIPGLELVEMEYNRERSLCCGGGGGGAFKDQPRDQSMGVERVREAMNTGSDVIATTCPYCIRMLNNAIQKLGVQKKIIVQDLAELLVQSVKVSE